MKLVGGEQEEAAGDAERGAPAPDRRRAGDGGSVTAI